jgi:hypothetical protein
MLIPLIPLSVLVLGVLAYAAYRSFQRREVSRGWHVAFFAAVLMGIAAGGYFGFFFKYSPRPGFEIHSFPVPAAFLVLEEYGNGKSQWTDFITPAPLLSAGANVPIFACLAVIPIWVLNTLSRMFVVRGQSQLAPVDISRPSK